MKVNVGDGLAVEIKLNVIGTPPGKLADANVYFTEGLLAGLCLIGFAVWVSREKPSEIDITVPARQFMKNGERRSFNLIRIDHPFDETKETTRQYYAPLDRLRKKILQAYRQVEASSVETERPPEEVRDDDIGF